MESIRRLNRLASISNIYILYWFSRVHVLVSIVKWQCATKEVNSFWHNAHIKIFCSFLGCEGRLKCLKTFYFGSFWIRHFPDWIRSILQNSTSTSRWNSKYFRECWRKKMMSSFALHLARYIYKIYVCLTTRFKVHENSISADLLTSHRVWTAWKREYEKVVCYKWILIGSMPSFAAANATTIPLIQVSRST